MKLFLLVPSKNYGCKVFYQRRGANVWKTRFDVFPSDKSDVSIPDYIHYTLTDASIHSNIILESQR